MSMEPRPKPEGDAKAREERQYQLLRDQSVLWRNATERVLDQIGLAPGMTCLDVGSGPGTAMQLLADRVGPEGHVTGLDLDGKLGRLALSDLRQAGGASFDFIEADVTTLESPSGSPFDVCFCRALLMQLRDPVAVLEKMQSWTKPGGYVVAQEFDFGAMAFEPPCPAMGEFNRVFEAVFRSHGRNMRAGRQLPAQFEAAGLGLPDGTDAEAKYIPLSGIADMLIGVYEGLFAAAAEFGLVDPARAAAFRSDLAEAAEDGRYYCLTPTLISAWKRVA